MCSLIILMIYGSLLVLALSKLFLVSSSRAQPDTKNEKCFFMVDIRTIITKIPRTCEFCESWNDNKSLTHLESHGISFLITRSLKAIKKTFSHRSETVSCISK